MTKRRIWQTSYGTVCLREEDWCGNEVIREFWTPSGGGYVREIDDTHPGTLGQQVCDKLYHMGSTLYGTPDSLLALIRHEYRRAVADRRREEAA